MIISIIAAIGRNGELGYNNKLIWHIPGDMAIFKKMTMGHHIIMGRKTYESIGRPLPGRVNFVLSRTDFPVSTHITKFTDLQTAIETAKLRDECEVFIIGGASIYKDALPIATRMYITHIDDEATADTWFNPDWKLWEIKDEICFNETPSWTFRTYEKIKESV